MAYIAADDRKRREAADELTQLNQEMGLSEVAFVVLYDANVLYRSALRDLLIRIAQAGLVQAKWSDRILDEVFDNLKRNRPDLDPEKLDRTRFLINRAVRDCLVVGYEPIEPGLDLPDPGRSPRPRRAIKARAQVIVTRNLKDFPADASHSGTST